MAAYHTRLNLQPKDDAIVAAVLILLFPNQDHQISTVFIERIKHEKDHHSGQIAFPGGRMDANDAGVIDCALREAHEEIDLQINQVRILGKLSPLYIPVSNYLVSPVVGMLSQSQVFTPQASEVADIMHKELEHFRLPTTRKHTDIEITSGFVLRQVPYFDLDGRVLWGATAMILNELLVLMR